MSIIGWAKHMWHPDTPDSMRQDHELLVSLAGNAYSAFAFGPIATVGLAIAGANTDNFPGTDQGKASDSNEARAADIAVRSPTWGSSSESD